jgi:hypothetical protein
MNIGNEKEKDFPHSKNSELLTQTEENSKIIMTFCKTLTISVRGGHCDHMPWATKNLAMPIVIVYFQSKVNSPTQVKE